MCDVQKQQRVAFLLTDFVQYGHGRSVGSTAGALRRVFSTIRTKMNMHNDTIKKLMTI
jgi:hypothetical protein